MKEWQDYMARRLVNGDVADWKILQNMTPRAVSNLIRDLIKD